MAYFGPISAQCGALHDQEQERHHASLGWALICVFGSAGRSGRLKILAGRHGGPLSHPGWLHSGPSLGSSITRPHGGTSLRGKTRLSPYSTPPLIEHTNLLSPSSRSEPMRERVSPATIRAAAKPPVRGVRSRGASTKAPDPCRPFEPRPWPVPIYNPPRPHLTQPPPLIARS